MQDQIESDKWYKAVQGIWWGNVRFTMTKSGILYCVSDTNLGQKQAVKVNKYNFSIKKKLFTFETVDGTNYVFEGVEQL